MFKTMIAGVTALALTVTPLQAEEFNNDDFGKFLFGLVAAAIAVNAIKSRNDSDPAPQATQLNPRYEPPVVRNHGGLNPPRINPRGNNNHVNAPRHGRNVLPRACIHPIETRYGTHRVFTRHCLNRNGINVDALPRRCAVQLLNKDGNARYGFDPTCMRDQGFAIRNIH